MVSWRIWIYIPILASIALGFYFKALFIITVPLLIYGIAKILTRSCWRKYFTFLFALGLNLALIFKIGGSAASTTLFVLMLLEVF